MKIFVVSIPMHKDGIHVEEYELIKQTKHSFTVMNFGQKFLMKKSLYKYYFTDENEMKTFILNKINELIKYHDDISNNFKNILKNGIKIIENQSEPFIKSGKIKL